MQGTIEKTSQYGVMFNGVWHNHNNNPELIEAIKKLNKGDKVEYESKPRGKGFGLVSIKEIGGVGYNKATLHYNKETLQSHPSYTDIMKECVKEVNGMIMLIDNPEIREKIVWSSIINSLFISKTK